MSNLTEIFFKFGEIGVTDMVVLGLVVFCILLYFIVTSRIPANVAIMLGFLFVFGFSAADPIFQNMALILTALGGGVIFYGIWTLLQTR
jgi:hypothetical protein